ncbi:chemotaxis protein CheW [uncultured Erythrobacter sp.]|uniref:chemotaxis protein CheW n=1 Tax=uncultured Erythrobacter sp. TaxID=263913 RepID=UPI00262BBC06|nr:chemotaxis protein CheW [uncultured Erythrobacter sp.]
MQELLVMSQIAGRRCAFPAHDVKSVIEMGAITPVPCSPDFIEGITAMRSQALTVIDCRRALGLDPASWSLDDRAIVVLVEGHFYALRIDSIEDITTAIGKPEGVPGGFGKEWSRVATGMVETSAGPALLIDLSLLIAGPEALGVAA